MTWPFCPKCHSTVKVESSGDIICIVCNYTSNLDNNQNVSSIGVQSITTYSQDRPIPIWARSDKEQEQFHNLTKNKQNNKNRATIKETCPKCLQDEVGYYTVQLRSVDEGQTVFYECPKCNYTWSINN
jgi:DNA-directed RNA polymerase I subunit RPA12